MDNQYSAVYALRRRIMFRFAQNSCNMLYSCTPAYDHIQQDISNFFFHHHLPPALALPPSSGTVGVQNNTLFISVYSFLQFYLFCFRVLCVCLCNNVVFIHYNSVRCACVYLGSYTFIYTYIINTQKYTHMCTCYCVIWMAVILNRMKKTTFHFQFHLFFYYKHHSHRAHIVYYIHYSQKSLKTPMKFQIHVKQFCKGVGQTDPHNFVEDCIKLRL